VIYETAMLFESLDRGIGLSHSLQRERAGRISSLGHSFTFLVSVGRRLAASSGRSFSSSRFCAVLGTAFKFDERIIRSADAIFLNVTLNQWSARV
jgi:hypothetical protein